MCQLSTQLPAPKHAPSPPTLPPRSKGVCGAAASTRATQLVPDVHAFPGHIACASSTRSEVVVPVTAPDGRLLAVLDVDSGKGTTEVAATRQRCLHGPLQAQYHNCVPSWSPSPLCRLAGRLHSHRRRLPGAAVRQPGRAALGDGAAVTAADTWRSCCPWLTRCHATQRICPNLPSPSLLLRVGRKLPVE